MLHLVLNVLLLFYDCCGDAYLVSTMFCWESFMWEGRFSVGGEEHVPMVKTGGSWAMKLK